MSGYTPVFKSVFQGSLCGKYPDTAAWLILLALADKNGEIDSTPQYISAVTGMPVDILTECIQRFLEPDPYSRTPDNDGRRLELIDPDRAWGWRLVNHSKYREKARKAAYDAARVEDGRNAQRLKKTEHHPTPSDAIRDDPTPSAIIRDDPLSNTNTNTNTNAVLKTHMSSSQANPTAVDRIFDHWRSVHGHDRAKLDDKRRRLIGKALKSYDEATLCQAITGYLHSPHHQGQNDRGTKYDGLELILRDAAHIDAGLRFYADPPSNVSRITRANIAAVEDWRPPELRAAT